MFHNVIMPENVNIMTSQYKHTMSHILSICFLARRACDVSECGHVMSQNVGK